MLRNWEGRKPRVWSRGRRNIYKYDGKNLFFCVNELINIDYLFLSAYCWTELKSTKIGCKYFYRINEHVSCFMWHFILISHNVEWYHNQNNNRLYQYLEAVQTEYKQHEKIESLAYLVNKEHRFLDHAWIAVINHTLHLWQTILCSWWLIIILDVMSGLPWTRKTWAM